jgi:hypothetical protein
VHWLTAAGVVLLVLLGLGRLPIPALFGLAVMIGLADAHWFSPARQDWPARVFRRWPLQALIVAAVLTVASLLPPLR